MLESKSNNNYHYREYLQTVLNYGSDATDSHLASQHFFSNFGRIIAGKYV